MGGEAFCAEQRRKLDVEECHTFLFSKDKTLILFFFLFAKKESRPWGQACVAVVIGHLTPVKLLLVIRYILKSAFSANT